MKSLLGIISLFISPLLIAQNSNLHNEIEKIIAFDSEISFDLTPGFIVGVIDNDSVYYESFGRKVHTHKQELHKSDVFELGSISKTLTASLIHTLVDKGIMSYDNKVNDLVPIDYKNPRLKSLTIKDLLNFNTSFPKRPAMIGEFEDEAQDPYKYYTKERLLQYYSYFVPEKGVKFNYSHINYALLEIIAETKTGQTFDDLLAQHLFSDLGMNNSFVHFKEKKNNVVIQGVDRSSTQVGPWTFPAFAGSEGIKSSVADLSQYAKAVLGYSQTNLDKILPPQTLLNNPSFNEELYHSMGWHVVNVNKKFRVLVANGTTSGHSAFIGLVPNSKTGVIVLSNSSFGTKDLGMLILRMINYNWKRKIQ
jgi:CubicO group peptidase (beta-lactamase class C family)